MKKLLALFLALVMILSLAACGNKQEPQPAEPDQQEEQQPEETPDAADLVSKAFIDPIAAWP